MISLCPRWNDWAGSRLMIARGASVSHNVCLSDMTYQIVTSDLNKSFPFQLELDKKHCFMFHQLETVQRAWQSDWNNRADSWDLHSLAAPALHYIIHNSLALTSSVLQDWGCIRQLLIRGWGGRTEVSTVTISAIPRWLEARDHGGKSARQVHPQGLPAQRRLQRGQVRWRHRHQGHHPAADLQAGRGAEGLLPPVRHEDGQHRDRGHPLPAPGHHHVPGEWWGAWGWHDMMCSGAWEVCGPRGGVATRAASEIHPNRFEGSLREG